MAFAGSGTITVVHGLAAQLLRLPVVAVASRDPDHARQRAEQLDAQPVTYDELPAGADLVVVATTPERHAADALRALAAGSGALVEKPLCTTLEQADRLVEAAGRGYLAYAENLLHAPAVKGAIEHIDQINAAGRLVHLEASALQGPPDWGAFFEPERGGGALFDLGAHPIALVLRAAPGRAIGVRAALTTAPGRAVDDEATVEVDFDDGLTAHVQVSWRSEEVRWDLQAAADQGVVRLELVPNLGVERDGDELALVPPSYAEVPQLEQMGYAAQLASATADVAEGRHPEIGAAFGRAVLDVVCGAYRSAGRGGATEPLPFTGPRDRTPHELWSDPGNPQNGPGTPQNGPGTPR